MGLKSMQFVRCRLGRLRVAVWVPSRKLTSLSVLPLVTIRRDKR